MFENRGLGCPLVELCRRWALIAIETQVIGTERIDDDEYQALWRALRAARDQRESQNCKREGAPVRVGHSDRT